MEIRQQGMGNGVGKYRSPPVAPRSLYCGGGELHYRHGLEAEWFATNGVPSIVGDGKDIELLKGQVLIAPRYDLEGSAREKQWAGEYERLYNEIKGIMMNRMSPNTEGAFIAPTAASGYGLADEGSSINKDQSHGTIPIPRPGEMVEWMTGDSKWFALNKQSLQHMFNDIQTAIYRGRTFITEYDVVVYHGAVKSGESYSIQKSGRTGPNIHYASKHAVLTMPEVPLTKVEARHYAKYHSLLTKLLIDTFAGDGGPFPTHTLDDWSALATTLLWCWVGVGKVDTNEYRMGPDVDVIKDYLGVGMSKIYRHVGSFPGQIRFALMFGFICQRISALSTEVLALDKSFIPHHTRDRMARCLRTSMPDFGSEKSIWFPSWRVEGIDWIPVPGMISPEGKIVLKEVRKKKFLPHGPLEIRHGEVPEQSLEIALPDTKCFRYIVYADARIVEWETMDIDTILFQVPTQYWYSGEGLTPEPAYRADYLMALMSNGQSVLQDAWELPVNTEYAITTVWESPLSKTSRALGIPYLHQARDEDGQSHGVIDTQKPHKPINQSAPEEVSGHDDGKGVDPSESGPANTE